MNWKLRLKLMVAALRKSGFRSVLALGAVGMGIASMMIMMALSTGATLELQAIAERVGENLFMVKAGEVRASPGRGEGWYEATTLDENDRRMMLDQIRGIRAVVPILEGSKQVTFQGEELVTTVRGVNPEYLGLRNFEVASGRFIDQRDRRARSRVAVLGAFVVDNLNGGFSMIGETVWIDGVPFEVIGQLEEKGTGLEGQNEDDQILIPVETALRRVFNVDYLSRLLVQVETQDRMQVVQDATRELLRESHDLDPDVEDDFDILTLIRSDEIQQMNSAFLNGMAQLFAAVTLAIGGAGVLAVTFLNVKDRTPEIGLRMAVGARRRDIARLFVAEACLLSASGGILGLLLGWVGVVTLRRMTDWAMAVDPTGVLVSLVVSVFIGLSFSVAPALRASKIVPVTALEYD